MRREFKNITEDELHKLGYRLFLPNGSVDYAGVYMTEFDPNGVNISAYWYDYTNQSWKDFCHEFIFEADFFSSDGKSFRVKVKDDRPLEEIHNFFETVFENMNCIPEGSDD